MRDYLVHGQPNSDFAASAASTATDLHRSDADDVRHDRLGDHPSDVPWQPTMMDQSCWLAQQEGSPEATDMHEWQAMQGAHAVGGAGRR